MEIIDIIVDRLAVIIFYLINLVIDFVSTN